MKPITAVAISGGVDSLVAAFLLLQQNYQLIGIHFITGFEGKAGLNPERAAADGHPILDIGMQLGIPIRIIDIRTEFKQKVVDYFCRTYHSGQTPNPCMRCNRRIKFGTIFDIAKKLGATSLATGHYARIESGPGGNHRLFKGIDARKDQSYFLARLNRRQLARARFPLGDLKKSDVRQIAAQKGLYPVSDAESQDVCFIKDETYAEFLAKQTGMVPQPGRIETTDGTVIGEHHGLHRFTIGQRRGINCPAAEPYYVIRLDSSRNRLIVGTRKDLLSDECRVTNINWIGNRPMGPIDLLTRVRYRSTEVASTVVPLDDQTAIVRFKVPQSAVTPGQGAVFYEGDEVLGGGWISPEN